MSRTVVGAIGRADIATVPGVLVGRVVLGIGAAALVGGEDPRKRSAELAYRPLTKVRIRSTELITKTPR